MKVAILIFSSLAATLAGPQYFPNRETSVEGRQFSDDPIINYAGWGFIAGLADYFIRDFASSLTTTTTTTTTTAAPRTAAPRKKVDNNKVDNKRKERKQKKAERKAAKLAAKRKAAEEAKKKAEQMADDDKMSQEQVDETAAETEEV